MISICVFALVGPMLKTPQGRPILNTLMYTLVPIMAITFMVAIGYWMYRRQRMAYFNEVLSTQSKLLSTIEFHVCVFIPYVVANNRAINHSPTFANSNRQPSTID